MIKSLAVKTVIAKIGLVLILITFSLHGLSLGDDEKSAIKAIKTGDIELLKAYLEKNPDANCAFTNGKTGLYYAILYDQDRVARYLLDKGADPNRVVSDHSTLQWAIKHGRARTARYLIEYGADVNRPDDKRNTPLFYAAELGQAVMCKILVDRGANPLHENNKGKRASYYATSFTDSPAYEYLVSMEGQYKEHVSVPSLRDGPYIFWEGSDEVVMTYFERDQEKNLTRMIEKTILTGETVKEVECTGPDGKSYLISNAYSPDTCRLETAGDIFVVGDVHGRGDALASLLMNNKIIDAKRNWIFGNGQLVLLGDVFDRGGMVTETLWFLYELDIQARAAGGRVQLLLGNHEIMALTGDHRYLNQKYTYFTHYFNTEYYQLFARNTVMGMWLRSQSLALCINGNMFLHAGISPQFAVMGYSCEDINTRVRTYLESDEKLVKGSPEHMILGNYGPVWYRGYGGYGDTEARFPELTQDFIDTYLEANGLKRMIIGHNEQSAIVTSFQGKVISADVAIDESGLTAQGLLISGDTLFRCYADGKKEELVD